MNVWSETTEKRASRQCFVVSLSQLQLFCQVQMCSLGFGYWICSISFQDFYGSCCHCNHFAAANCQLLDRLRSFLMTLVTFFSLTTAALPSGTPRAREMSLLGRTIARLCPVQCSTDCGTVRQRCSRNHYHLMGEEEAQPPHYNGVSETIKQREEGRKRKKIYLAPPCEKC